MKEIGTLLTIIITLYLYLSMPPNHSLTNKPDKLGGNTMESKPRLPKTVGIWTRPDSPKLVDAKNIFDYMDGAGELYLAYRFDNLESYTYQAEGQKEILVEVYFMKTSDDAFGLLSLDWGGEPVALGQSLRDGSKDESARWPRALYGEGLLRIWSDTVYARIMSYLETPESREAVLSIGRAVVEGRDYPPEPSLLDEMPRSFGGQWRQSQQKASFFRSHLVLNSLFYLGQETLQHW